MFRKVLRSFKLTLLSSAPSRNSRQSRWFSSDMLVQYQQKKSTDRAGLTTAQHFEGSLLFQIGPVKYIAWPATQSKLALARLPRDRYLVTVIAPPPGDQISKDWLQSYIEENLRTDDVFCRDFLAGIIFQVKEPCQMSSDMELSGLFDVWGTDWIGYICKAPSGLSPGPYIWESNVLWKTYRLYDDTSNAFMASLTPFPDMGYKNLCIGGEPYQCLSIAVASRIAPLESSELPFSGVRIAVKDMYRINGLRNSLGNRAYYDLDKPSCTTAASIGKLTNGGAQLLGLTKLNCFAAREELSEAVDYQSAFNPRGDGYQSPAGSSSGSAAAIATYDWLDFAIGSDTTGSGRRPAIVNGCFALRPSHDALPLDGMILTFELFDIPCLFGRDITKFPAFVAAWYGSEEVLQLHAKEALPPLIVYPLDCWLISNSQQIKIVGSFVKDLEPFVGVDSTAISIAEAWAKSPPKEAQGQSI